MQRFFLTIVLCALLTGVGRCDDPLPSCRYNPDEVQELLTRETNPAEILCSDDYFLRSGVPSATEPVLGAAGVEERYLKKHNHLNGKPNRWVAVDDGRIRNWWIVDAESGKRRGIRTKHTFDGLGRLVGVVGSGWEISVSVEYHGNGDATITHYLPIDGGPGSFPSRFSRDVRTGLLWPVPGKRVKYCYVDNFALSPEPALEPPEPGKP